MIDDHPVMTINGYYSVCSGEIWACMSRPHALLAKAAIHYENHDNDTEYNNHANGIIV